jgi:hypothetical protein
MTGTSSLDVELGIRNNLENQMMESSLLYHGRRIQQRAVLYDKKGMLTRYD